MAALVPSAAGDAMQSPGRTVEFMVDGMSCASCVGHVEKALSAAPGVSSVSVNLATSRATVTLTGAIQPPELVKVVEAAGYEVPAETMELAIEGMTCASCVSRVEKALAKVPGVIDAAVNLATGRATLRSAGGVDADALVAAVSEAGYEARLSSGGADSEQERRSLELSRLRGALRSRP